MQQAGMQDFYRDFLKSRKVVRGIGKHYIISRMRTHYETENITTDKSMLVLHGCTHVKGIQMKLRLYRQKDRGP